MAFDLKLCNKKRLKKRADYGIRVARPGYDANSCAQNQLVFNSNWPIIQIADVIDLSKNVPTKYVWVSENFIGGYTREWSETEPTGITYTYQYSSPSVSVGRNYLWYTTEYSIGTDGNGKEWRRISYKQIYHGLGYQPMFYRSEDISSIPGYVVITSVDLSTDIDYPYTEGATMFFGSMKDYGISSISKFGSKVPGLRSDMFSKLVQAVKTEETSNSPNSAHEAGTIYWSPLSKLENYQKCLEPYEAVAYYGFDNPFGDILRDVDIDGNLASGFGTDGPYYRDDQAIVRAVPYSEVPSTSVFGDGVAFTDKGQATYGNRYASMVVIRSPMVSPEYEEITV